MESKTRRRHLMWFIAITMLLAAPLTAQAWIPDEYFNLKMLPKDISKEDLVNTMRSFREGLGVRCTYCHVREGNPEQFNFPSDDKGTKKKARVMFEMVAAINGTYLPRIKDDEYHSPEVSCMTCHRGKQMPEF